MRNCSALVEAIDRLTSAVNQPENSFMGEFVSTALATIGSVAAVLIFEVIKNKIITPREEFRKLQRRVNSTLSMYSCYYTNPIRSEAPMVSEKTREDYISASLEVRRLAVDVLAFADERKGKKCCGIAVEDIRSAGRNMIGLSNSFFSVGNHPELETGKQQEDRIVQLLGIAKKR